MPHSIINGYKRVLAVAVETDYTFPLAEKVMAGFELYTGMLEMQPSTFTACPLFEKTGTCLGTCVPYVVNKWLEKADLPGVPSLGLLHSA